MHRRATLGVVLVLLVGGLAGCQALAPQQAPSPSVTYSPVDVRVEAPDTLRPNQTGTVTVHATLKQSHPAYVSPNTSVTAIDNVSVTVAPSELVVGSAGESPTRLVAGETATWTVEVCAATPLERSLSVTLVGTPVTANGSAAVPAGWAQSRGEATLHVGMDGASENTTASTAIRAC